MHSRHVSVDDDTLSRDHALLYNLAQYSVLGRCLETSVCVVGVNVKLQMKSAAGFLMRPSVIITR